MSEPTRPSTVGQLLHRVSSRGQEAAPGDALIGLPVLPPWGAIGEIAAFVLAILALEWFAPAFDLNAVQPHPCWLPVLLLSLQYGTVSGMLAAFISIAIYAIGGFPEQDVGENHFAYLLRIWGQPMLWVAAAVLFGQFRMRQIAAKIELRRSVVELERQRAAISAFADNLRRRCDMLERHIAARAEPAALDVLSRLASIGSADGQAVESEFAAIMRAAFPGAKASLYRREADAFVRVATAGHAADATVTEMAARLPATGAASSRLLSLPGAVSVLTQEGERALAGSGVAAAPVRDATGEVCGLLKLESIEPVQLGPALPGALQTIASALAPMLDSEARLGAERARVGEHAEPAASGQSRSWRRLRWFSPKPPLAAEPPRPPVKAPVAR